MTAEKILELITPKFEGDVTGHDIYHIQRVLNMSRELQKKEGGDLRLIEYAAVLHDLDDHKFNGGKLNSGGETAMHFLLEQGIDRTTSIAVKEIVDQISFKGAHTNVRSLNDNIETQIVQDADRLDALGAIGIARTFAYGGFKGQQMYLPEFEPHLHQSFEEYAKSKTTSINHFHEKLLLLKDRLNTNSAKQIALERHRFMEEFLDRFYAEWEVKLN